MERTLRERKTERYDSHPALVDAGHELVPIAVIGELYDKRLDAEVWAARARELGIADLSLMRSARASA